MTRGARATGGLSILTGIPRFITGMVQLAGATAQRITTANVPALAGAISFHALLSLAPLLLLVLTAAASLLGGSEAARARLLGAIDSLGDPAVVPPLRATVLMIVGARGTVLGNTVGVLLMMYFASAVFHEIGAALDRIWDVPPRAGLGGLLVQRLVAFVLVPAAVAAGMLVMAVSFLHALIAPIVANLLPHGGQFWAWSRVLIPFLSTTVLLGLVYRYGTRSPIRWGDVRLGAVLAALAFSAGNVILAIMLRKSLLASLYGKAGALVLLLLWIFYSTHLLLIGACFTREYADRFGSRRQAS